jgi:hypothetical protein
LLICTSSRNNKSDTNYDQGFRLGVGLNAGYSTNDPYKLALEQMLEDNTIYQKDTLTLTTGYTNLLQSGLVKQKERFRYYSS